LSSFSLFDGFQTIYKIPIANLYMAPSPVMTLLLFRIIKSLPLRFYKFDESLRLALVSLELVFQGAKALVEIQRLGTEVAKVRKQVKEQRSSLAKLGFRDTKWIEES